MKILLVIFGVVVLGFGVAKFVGYWQEIEQRQQVTNQVAHAVVVPEQLPGISHQIEDSLRQAQQQGPKAVREWLDNYKRSPMV